MAFQLSGNLLSLVQLEEILQKRLLLELPADVLPAIPLPKAPIPASQANLAQDYIAVHAVGLGAELPEEIVRLGFIIHLKMLLNQKQTEIQAGTLNRLVTYFNRDIFPIVLQEGTDSAKIAQLIIPLLGLGKVKYQGYELNAPDILDIFSWEPLNLHPGEAATLLQGPVFSLAHTAHYLLQIKHTITWASYLAQVFTQIADTASGNIIEQTAQLQSIYESASAAFAGSLQDIFTSASLESLTNALSALQVNLQDTFETLADYVAQTYTNLISTSEPPATTSFEQALTLTKWLQHQATQKPVTNLSAPDKSFLLQHLNKSLATFIPVTEQLVVLAFWSVSQVGKVFNLVTENITLAAYYHSELFVPKETVTTQLDKVLSFIKNHHPTLKA